MEGANVSLKNQFSQLQEQQQKKLAKRKQMKEDREKQKEKKNAVPDGPTFGIGDDLELKLSEPPAQTSSYISEELINSLNDQLREMKDETGRLYKLLSERDFEIRQLKKKREEDRLALTGGGVASDTAAMRIVELSKKVREQTAELEAEKTRNKQFTKKCRDLENQLQMARASGGQDVDQSRRIPLSAHSDGDGDTGPTEEDFKALQEKLKQAEMKATEFRNQAQTIKQELKVAHKVLANEVGDGVSIQSLLNANSGSRGRAQQILALQKKVTELKAQLGHQQSGQQQCLGGTLDGDLEAEFMGMSMASASTTRRSTMDERQREQIRRLEKDRKEQQEKAGAELKALEADHTALKQKMDAAKARTRVLSSEIKANKQQIQKLLDKSKNDDEMIEALMKQLSHMKQLVESSSQMQAQNKSQQENKLKELSMKTQHDTNIVEKLKNIIADKEATVKTLEQEINTMRMNKQINSVQSLFQKTSTPPSSAGRRVPPIADDGTTLSSPVPSLSRQSDRSLSRQSMQNGDASERSSSRKSNRPNSGSLPISERSRPQEFQELTHQCHELQALYKAAEVERDRLTELAQVLQQRLDAASLQAVESQSEMQQQRRKNVQLEKQLGKLKIEQTKSSKVVSARRAKTKTSMSGRDVTFLDEESVAESQPASMEDVEELQTSLAIQKDENEALKAALQRTLKAKEEDLKLYHDVMEETKKVFLHGLRQYKQTQSS